MSRIADALRLTGISPDSFERVPPAHVKDASESDLVDISVIGGQGTPAVPTEGAFSSADDLQQPAVNVVSQSGLLGIPVDIAPPKKLRILPHSADPQLAEYYRIIRANIQQQSKSAFRTLLVASAGPQEGKSLTVLNLAWTFAMLPSLRVLVVDGDLRNGNLGATLGLGYSLGFSNFIEGGAKLEDVVFKWDALPMKVMGRGNAKLSPGELLQSPLLRERIQKLTEHFDLVLIDSPPATMFADAKLLASACDAVLLVARAFSTTSKVLKQVCEDLQQFKIVGTVLNGVVRPGSYRRYQYYSGLGRDQ